jgi:hypothetical protein
MRRLSFDGRQSDEASRGQTDRQRQAAASCNRQSGSPTQWFMAPWNGDEVH